MNVFGLGTVAESRNPVVQAVETRIGQRSHFPFRQFNPFSEYGCVAAPQGFKTWLGLWPKNVPFGLKTIPDDLGRVVGQERMVTRGCGNTSLDPGLRRLKILTWQHTHATVHIAPRGHA